MTEPERAATSLETDVSTVEEPAPPPPEPWTPERVLEWNRYYDLYVAAGVVLLVFFASAHYIAQANLWSHLQTGRLIARGGPVTTDPFSYSMAGRNWVNIPWLFQVSHAAIYDAARRVNLGNPDQLAAGVLVGLAAAARALTALVLLRLSRRGPGLWWVAVCVLLALGAVVAPMPGSAGGIAPILGGIARPADVGPETWGVLFLAIELLLLDRAYNRGRPRALIGLVPLFLLWANTDDSFLFGLILAAVRLGVGLAGRGRVAGLRREPGGEGAVRVSPGLALGALGGSLVACVLNPSFVAIFPAAASRYLSLFRPASEVLTADQISYFGRQSWSYFNRLHGGEQTGAYRLYIAFYLVLVGAGVASFVANRRRFSAGRAALFGVAALLWGALAVLAPEFAVVWAAVVALNGSEWYRDTYGAGGRVGGGWTAWSIGGRAVTLLAITAMLVKGLTGYGASPAEPAFGFGVNNDEFPFEVADYLAGAPIEGNVLNLTLASGDALIWRAWPKNPLRKTYIDGRSNLFPRALRAQLQDIRRALAEGDTATWKPLLDGYGISVVLVPIGSDPNVQNTARVYNGLAKSPDWTAFYDDGTVVLFGRRDAAPNDVAHFEKHPLQAEILAFRTARTIPPTDRTPTPTGTFDRFFQNRGRRMPQPHVWAAERWLTTRLADPNAAPPLANALLAIGELRTALATHPNDATAWRLLASSYRILGAREAALLAPGGDGLPAGYTNFRLQQRATVLNFAIQSTPPPRTQDARLALADLHRELGQLYLVGNSRDLARDQFESARRLGRPEDEASDLAEAAQLAQLEEQVDQVQTALAEATRPDGQPLTPFERIDFALNNGAPGLALQELEDAEATGLLQGPAKSQLLDLYCRIGRADKALELLGTTSGDIEDPALNTGPGTASYRQGLVYFLIGNYDLSRLLWRDRAIPQLRSYLTTQAMEATRTNLRGGARAASEMFQQLPDQIAQQATWEFHLALCLLEGGAPEEAGTHFTKALTLQPDYNVRPLIAYYLEQLGLPVPPAPEPDRPALPLGGGASTPAVELPADVFSKPATPPPATP
jgi:tetratricopeptide (TPR) repeat protein